MEIDRRDLQWNIYTNASDSISMTLIHKPTGLSVGAVGNSRIGLHKKLMRQLEELLDDEHLCP